MDEGRKRERKEGRHEPISCKHTRRGSSTKAGRVKWTTERPPSGPNTEGESEKWLLHPSLFCLFFLLWSDCSWPRGTQLEVHLEVHQSPHYSLVNACEPIKCVTGKTQGSAKGGYGASESRDQPTSAHRKKGEWERQTRLSWQWLEWL